MLLFAAAFFGLIITPGPGVLSTAGVGSAYGFRPGVAYIVGLFIGTNITMALVASGVWATAVSIPWLRDALFWASTAYLLYLALKIALAGSKIAFIHAERPPGVLGGVLLQLVNPKAYVVGSTLFGGFNFMPDNLALETALKFAITQCDLGSRASAMAHGRREAARTRPRPKNPTHHQYRHGDGDARRRRRRRLRSRITSRAPGVGRPEAPPTFQGRPLTPSRIERGSYRPPPSHENAAGGFADGRRGRSSHQMLRSGGDRFSRQMIAPG